MKKVRYLTLDDRLTKRLEELQGLDYKIGALNLAIHRDSSELSRKESYLELCQDNLKALKDKETVPIVGAYKLALEETHKLQEAIPLLDVAIANNFISLRKLEEKRERLTEEISSLKREILSSQKVLPFRRSSAKS